MKNYYFCYGLNISILALAQIKSPYEFLPTYGKQITHYHQVEEYFNYLTTKLLMQTPEIWRNFQNIEI